jgi:hypothetical protein
VGVRERGRGEGGGMGGGGGKIVVLAKTSKEVIQGSLKDRKGQEWKGQKRTDC